MYCTAHTITSAARLGPKPKVVTSGMKRRLCSYVVPRDTGFAPNPVGQFCTLAACTPNHQGLKLRAGDWIVGTEPSSRESKLVYAMQVSEVLDFDTYFV